MNDSILRERLDSGEKLLWSGTSCSGGDDRAEAPEPAVKSMYGVILKALTVPVVLLTIIAIPVFGALTVMALPFWVVLGILLFLYIRPEDWIYGITDKRVFAGTERSGIASYGFGGISDIQQYTGKNGIGCVTFTAGGQLCGFYGLKEPEKVCGILKAAKDNFLE